VGSVGATDGRGGLEAHPFGREGFKAVPNRGREATRVQKREKRQVRVVIGHIHKRRPLTLQRLPLVRLYNRQRAR